MELATKDYITNFNLQKNKEGSLKADLLVWNIMVMYMIRVAMLQSCCQF